MSAGGRAGLSGTQASPARHTPSTHSQAGTSFGASTAAFASRRYPRSSNRLAIRHETARASS